MEPGHAPRPTRSTRCAGWVVIVGIVGGAMAMALAVLPAAPVLGAQPDPGITVEAVHPLGGGSFHFIVALTDGNGDPLTGTTVTATPIGPGGDTGAVVALPSSGDGTYQGPVPLTEDGPWIVRIASADPAGVIDYGYEVSGDGGTPFGAGPTTAPPATTLPPTTAAPTTAPPATTTLPPTTGAGAGGTTATTGPEAEDGTESASTRATDEDDDGGFPIVVLIVGAALVVALAGVPLALRTIRSANTSSGDDGPSDPADDA
jgi:hypothetical protein